jgi:hypothetical protein
MPGLVPVLVSLGGVAGPGSGPTGWDVVVVGAAAVVVGGGDGAGDDTSVGTGPTGIRGSS